MTAGDRLFARARIFYSDARAVADPFFDLDATFIGKTRVDRGAAGKMVLIPLQNLEDFHVVGIWRKRLLQRAADFLSDRSLDAHAFDEKVVSLILLDGALGCKAMEVVVPDSVSDQLVPRGESVSGRVDEEFTWVHMVLCPVFASCRLILAASRRSATSCLRFVSDAAFVRDSRR